MFPIQNKLRQLPFFAGFHSSNSKWDVNLVETALVRIHAFLRQQIILQLTADSTRMKLDLQYSGRDVP